MGKQAKKNSCQFCEDRNVDDLFTQYLAVWETKRSLRVQHIKTYFPPYKKVACVISFIDLDGKLRYGYATVSNEDMQNSRFFYCNKCAVYLAWKNAMKEGLDKDRQYNPKIRPESKLNYIHAMISKFVAKSTRYYQQITLGEFNLAIRLLTNLEYKRSIQANAGHQCCCLSEDCDSDESCECDNECAGECVGESKETLGELLQGELARQNTEVVSAPVG